MVAILSLSTFAGPPQTDDMRIQPNPSLETSGPFLPSVIFVIVVIAVILLINNTKICVCAPWPVSLTAQFTCLDGSPAGFNSVLSYYDPNYSHPFLVKPLNKYIPLIGTLQALPDFNLNKHERISCHHKTFT